jgi:hypothetical protein
MARILAEVAPALYPDTHQLSLFDLSAQAPA